MSVLVRLIPFWLAGILLSWFTREICQIVNWHLMVLWIIVFFTSQASVMMQSRAIPGVSVYVALLVFTTGAIVSQMHAGDKALPAGKDLNLTGKVEKTWIGNGAERIKLRVISYSDAGNVFHADEAVLILKSTKLPGSPYAGSYISVKCRLTKIRARDKQEDFPEKLYWSGEGISKKGWAGELRSLDLGKGGKMPLRIRSANFQNHLAQRIDESSLSKDAASLVKAMILGKKEDLAPEIKDLFRKTGISHLLAVSGLHVGLIYLLFIKALSFLRRAKAPFILELIAIIAVWAYSYITGLGPSVQRAAGMISLYAFARTFRRRVSPLQVLITAFYLQTALDPFSVFRFGFQFSYLAVAGILVFYKLWSGICPVSKKMFKAAWNYAGISISAQVFTLPFILIYFHEFPLYFILGNLLIVPLGLVIFYSGAFYLLLVNLGVEFSLAAKAIDVVSGLLLNLSGIISRLPFSILSFNWFSVKELLLYYMILFIWSGRYPAGLYRKAIITAILLIFLSIARMI